MRPTSHTSVGPGVRPWLGLATSLALAVALLSAGPVASPAVAGARCAESGGADIPRAAASGEVVFRGGGWGHGLGMSQYGAQGAARLGCSYRQILGRYYAGTKVVTRAMPDSVRLRMLAGGNRVDVKAVQGGLAWVLPGCTGPTPENPAAPPCPPAQPAGAMWQLTLDDASAQFVLWNLDVIPKAELWRGGSADQALALEQKGSVARLTTWTGHSIYLDRYLRWDRTRFAIGSGRIDAVQQIATTAEGSAMDKYLWGIAEVPSSFPKQALKAQAVAARTYAVKRAGRVLMPTPADQNYTGWKKETEGPNGAAGARWRAAVDATSARVIASSGGGDLIDAFYSSSTGGYTEDERYVWGVESPWLRPVDDSRWDLASSNPAEKRSWAVGVSWVTLAKKLGFAEISDISVPSRGDPARNAGVKVTGVKGGQVVTTKLEGWDVRQALGLLSPGFTVSVTRVGGKAAQPIVGDWNGDGVDEPGWFRAGAFALAMTGDEGAWTQRFRFGRAGDVAVVGDWDGDGRDDIGVYRDGTWLLRAGLDGGPATTTFQYGRAGDRPVVGSWSGRTLGIGVVRGNRWMLRKSLTGGRTQRVFRYGRPGDEPVVGSWNGSARSGIGVERDGRWLLRNRRSAGKAGIRFRFGRASDRPVAGDWDGDGRTDAGRVRGRKFTLRTSLVTGAPPGAARFRG